MWNLRKSWKLLISFFFWLCETVLKLVAKCTIKCYCSYYNFAWNFRFSSFDVILCLRVSFLDNQLVLFQKKSGGWGYTLLKTSLEFSFFTLPLEIPDKTKLNPWIFHKIVLDPLRFQGPKQRPLEISHYFFLVTLGNSASFLINPWKLHLLFLWYPWKFHFFNPTFWNFFWYSPIQNLR